MKAVAFYRDIIGLPVLETFQDSYGLDGTILGLANGGVTYQDPRRARSSVRVLDLPAARLIRGGSARAGNWPPQGNARICRGHSAQLAGSIGWLPPDADAYDDGSNGNGVPPPGRRYAA